MNDDIKRINQYLGEELGFTPYGDPIYQWEWADDLFWPAYATGGHIEGRTESGIIFYQKEYKRDRMTKKTGIWIITKWCAPEDLPDWNRNFPGADYPARGYRIKTDWENKPGAPPFKGDTVKFVWALKKQLAMGRRGLDDAQLAEVEKRDQDSANRIEDRVEESIPAFVNPTPGKRGGNVSVPGSRFN